MIIPEIYHQISIEDFKKLSIYLLDPNEEKGKDNYLEDLSSNK